MALVEYAGFSTSLGASLSSVATSMTLPTSAAAALNAILGASDHLYLMISAPGTNAELVKATQGATPLVVIERAQGGSPATSFPAGACVRYVVGKQAIDDAIAEGPAGVSNVTGAGIAAVTTPVSGTRLVTVPAPAFTNSDGFIVLGGTWPNMTFNFSPGKQTQEGTVTEVLGSADFAIAGDPTLIPEINLTAILGTLVGNAYGSFGSGGTICGLWVTNTGRVAGVDVQSLTNGVFNNAAVTVSSGRITGVVAGAAAGVTSVTAGNAKIVIGGSGVAPTVALAISGVAAGSYGGLTIDAYGTVTAVAGGFNPVSTITATPANVVITYPVSGTVNIAVPAGTTAAAGLLRMSTTGEATDFTNATLAINGAGLKAAINSVGALSTTKQATVGITANALPYTAASLAVTGTIARAMVVAHLRWSNDATPFDASIAIDGTPVQGSGGVCVGGSRTLVYLAEALAGTITVQTTAIGGDTVAADIQVLPFVAVP